MGQMKLFIVHHPNDGGMVILDRVSLEEKMENQVIDFFIPVFRAENEACEFARSMNMTNITLTELTLESAEKERLQ